MMQQWRKVKRWQSLRIKPIYKMSGCQVHNWDVQCHLVRGLVAARCTTGTFSATWSEDCEG